MIKTKLPLDLLVEQLKKDLRRNSFIYDHKTPLIVIVKKKDKHVGWVWSLGEENRPK